MKSVAERQRAWRLSHPDEHRERMKQYMRLRRERERIDREPISIKDVYFRDGALCHICGEYVSPADASRDHVVPLSKGGINQASNVRLAHLACNQRRGTNALVPNVSRVS